MRISPYNSCRLASWTLGLRTSRGAQNIVEQLTLFQFKATFPKNYKSTVSIVIISLGSLFHCPLHPPLFPGGLATTQTLRQPRFHRPVTEYCFDQKLSSGEGLLRCDLGKILLTSKSCPSKDNSFIFRNIFFPNSSKDKGDIVIMGTGESEPTNSLRSQTSASGFFT